MCGNKALYSPTNIGEEINSIVKMYYLLHVSLSLPLPLTLSLSPILPAHMILREKNASGTPQLLGFGDDGVDKELKNS